MSRGLGDVYKRQEYDICAEYVLAMLNDAALTQRFYQFLLSEHAQDIIRKNGFKND